MIASIGTASQQSETAKVRHSTNQAGSNQPQRGPARNEEKNASVALQQAVRAALSARGYGPLQSIWVVVSKDSVILSGRVPSYYLKQLAQTEAQRVIGVEQVCNDLQVIYPE